MFSYSSVFSWFNQTSINQHYSFIYCLLLLGRLFIYLLLLSSQLTIVSSFLLPTILLLFGAPFIALNEDEDVLSSEDFSNSIQDK